MTLTQLAQAQTILIYGFGIEGRAAKNFLDRHASQATVVIHDDNNPAYQNPKDWAAVDIIILSSGIPRSKIPTAFTGQITTNTNLFFENLPEAIRRTTIGITGTKGKSTTAKFCFDVLVRAGYRAVLGGNYGVGLLSLFDDALRGAYDYIVVELSSYQLEYATTSPGVAIFLNLYPDHLDRHLTLKAYQTAKANLWRYQRPGDLLIFPASWQEFAITAQAGQQGQTLLFAPPIDQAAFSPDSIFRAPHLRTNLGTVAKLAEQLRIAPTVVTQAARAFVGLPHRLEQVMTVKGITFYDDAISTNPDSTLPSVLFLGQRLGSIILGGQDRGQDFTDLLAALMRAQIQIIIYDSETAPRLHRALTEAGYPRVAFVKDFQATVAKALTVTPPGTICLLSTAAPSYDRFKNFEEQGNQFKQAVLQAAGDTVTRELSDS